jgi:glutaredoxin
MLILYTTAGCHLCEDAEAILAYCQRNRADISWQAVDIADDDALVQQYGLRIPVIKSVQTGAEIGWPFDAGQVMALKTK